MSLVVCVYVPIGIVISGDSRTTGTIQQQVSNPQNPQQQITVKTNIVISDATSKVFMVFDRFGVATFGDSNINSLPIAHYVEQFQSTNQQSNTTLDLVNDLMAYFRSFNSIPNTNFIVAGYDNNQPFVYGVNIQNNTSQRHNFNIQQNMIIYGVAYGGDTDIVTRLLNNQQARPPFDIMNIQDASDFSRHLIRTTIDQLRFEPRFPSVGGSIDTLVIKNNETFFLEVKTLKV